MQPLLFTVSAYWFIWKFAISVTALSIVIDWDTAFPVYAPAPVPVHEVNVYPVAGVSEIVIWVP